MTHEHFAESVGAYVLDALPDGEREAFERHLRTCRACQDEVEHLRVAADALPHAVEPVAPPPALKASLMETVRREAAARPEPEPEPEPEPRPRRRRRLRLTPSLSLPRLRPATAALSAAALLAIGIAGGYGLSRTGGDRGDRRTLAASVDSRAGAASATLTIPPGGEQAVLRVRGMPPTGDDATYQVWLQRGGRVTSQSLFAVGRDGSGAAAIPRSVEGADAVMVTREPPGGSPAPTDRPMLTVSL